MLIGDLRNSGDDDGGVVAGLSPVSGDVGTSGTNQGETQGEEPGDTGDTGDTGETEESGGTADRDDREGQRQGMAVVSVQGMVHRPGLLTVDRDKRVGEVIDQAGGVRADGRVQGINLAEPVVDGMQVVVDADGSQVVYPGEQVQMENIPGGGTEGPSDPGNAAGLVNLNTADMTALTSLSGVGPATAEAIVSWRDTHGPFTTVEQLMEVKGIGPAKFEALRDHVTI